MFIQFTVSSQTYQSKYNYNDCSNNIDHLHKWPFAWHCTLFFYQCDQSVVEALSPVYVKMVELQLLRIFMFNDKHSGDNFLRFYKRAERAMLQL